ncbi:MAG: glycosyltransferase, partial [Deltaproteobacteria bacterium]|nr:glycosyltransferase [Deltaproteobacteria bacterium]
PDELVVCDDCSGDDTVEKLEAFAAYAPFEVRIERNPENLTTTANFAKAVGLCTGDVIFFADQDDVWRPAKIERMAGLLAEDAQAGAVFCNARVMDEALEPRGHDLWQALMFGRGERARVREGRAVEVFARHVVAAGMTLAFRSAYRDLYLPFPDLHDCHDAWVSFLIACVAPVRMVPETLVDYRVHGENQFGLRKLALSEQLDKARWQLSSGIFRHGIAFFTAIRNRLIESGRSPDPAVLALIEQKIAHCRSRDEMAPRLGARLPAIAREALSGRYWRFSYGLRSVAQDLWLR